MLASPKTVKKILIVDDQPLMRRSIVRLLGTEFFQVHDVADDSEAMNAAEHHTFDLAIIDVVLPGTGGPELAILLQQTQPDLPVVFISGYDQNRAEREGVKPADHFLQKPFSRVALLETMGRAMGDDHAQ